MQTDTPVYSRPITTTEGQILELVPIAAQQTLLELVPTAAQQTLAKMIDAVDNNQWCSGSVADQSGHFCAVGLIARYLP